jgi:hypothetical protein
MTWKTEDGRAKSIIFNNILSCQHLRPGHLLLACMKRQGNLSAVDPDSHLTAKQESWMDKISLS